MRKNTELNELNWGVGTVACVSLRLGDCEGTASEVRLKTPQCTGKTMNDACKCQLFISKSSTPAAHLPSLDGIPRDVLEGGGEGGEGGFGWHPPSSQGPPMVPAEGGPTIAQA